MSCKNSRIHLFAFHFRLSASFSFRWDKKSGGKLATESISEIKKKKEIKRTCAIVASVAVTAFNSHQRDEHIFDYLLLFSQPNKCVSTWLYLLSREIQCLFTLLLLSRLSCNTIFIHATCFFVYIQR